MASYQIRVFPVWPAPNGTCACPDGARCSSPGKHPIQRSWQQNATTNPEQIKAWSKRYQDCNWGMRTDDLPTADVDPRAGGSLEAAAALLPTTPWVVQTGGGGWHLGYLPPTDAPVPKGGNNLLGPGLDVKAKGGFVVCVGSVHASGQVYTWGPDGAPDREAIPRWAWVPPSLNGQPTGDVRTGGGPRSTLAALLASPPTVAGSGRNEWLTSVAGHVFRHFPYDDGAIEMIHSFNAGLAEPLENEEVTKIIVSIKGTAQDKNSAWYTARVESAVTRMRIQKDASQELRKDAWREPPFPLPGDEWLKIIYEEDPWSIVDLLPFGGNALLAAQYKIGKTTLLLNLVRAFCDSRPFLGRFGCTLEPGTRVGYFNYELPAAMLQRWVRRLNIRNPAGFIAANLRGFSIRMGTPEGDTWAVEFLKRENVQVWIIDPYAMAFSGESENDNTEVARFTDAIDAIKERAGVDVAILGAHFGRQNFETGDEHVRGATRLDDWADARWIMTRDAEGERYFSAIGRDVEVDEARLAFDRNSLALTLIEGERLSRSQERIVAEVLQYLARVGRSQRGEELKASITSRAIEANISGRATAVRAACKALVAKGSLILVAGDHGELWHYPYDHPEANQTGLHVVE